MTAGETGAPPHDDREQTFASRLTSLKEQGSALLVVGNVRSETYRTVCTRMLGEESAGSRRRLLVVTDDGTPCVESRLPTAAGPPDADIKLVSATPHSRSTAVETVPERNVETEPERTVETGADSNAHASPDATVEPTRVDIAELGELGIAVSEAVAEYDEAVDGLEPAELRVCFDSLRPVLAKHDEREVFQFLDLLTERLRGVDGMGHFHLPLARNGETVRTFEPLFDVLVHLRKRNGRLQQRWELTESGLSSGWLPL